MLLKGRPGRPGACDSSTQPLLAAVMGNDHAVTDSQQVEDDVLESYEEHHVADVLCLELWSMDPGVPPPGTRGRALMSATPTTQRGRRRRAGRQIRTFADLAPGL
jgi:hypothetical protein